MEEKDGFINYIYIVDEQAGGGEGWVHEILIVAEEAASNSQLLLHLF